MAEAWQAGEEPEEHWGDHEAWRGDIHPAEADSWRGEATAWGSEAESSVFEPALEDESATGWPEEMAGPEYWLFKRFGI